VGKVLDLKKLHQELHVADVGSNANSRAAKKCVVQSHERLRKLLLDANVEISALREQLQEAKRHIPSGVRLLAEMEESDG